MMGQAVSLSQRETCLGVVLSVSLALSSPVLAEDPTGGAKASAPPVPVRMDPDKMAGVGLPPTEPFIAPEQILEGGHRPRGAILYQGEELVMEVYEDVAGTYAIREPFPHDEYVLVLSGKLILTDANGALHEYFPGDSLMVPKGFTGVWKMLGNYRELVSIGRVAYERVYGPLPSAESADPTGK